MFILYGISVRVSFNGVVCNEIIVNYWNEAIDFWRLLIILKVYLMLEEWMWWKEDGKMRIIWDVAAKIETIKNV